MFLDGAYGAMKMSMFQKVTTSMAHVPLNMTLNVSRVIFMHIHLQISNFSFVDAFATPIAI